MSVTGASIRRVLVPTCVGWVMLATWAVLHAAAPQATPAVLPPAQPDGGYGPVLDRYCVACHNERVRAGSLTLDTRDLTDIPADAEVWEKVVRKVRAGMMPPPGRPRPDRETRGALTAWLETTLDRAAAATPRPGRPGLHRLNRAEYENAIRDLLALDVDASSLLPPDDSIDGFDNNAAVLGVSPALLERYLSAALKVSALSVGDPGAGSATATYRTAPDLSQTHHVEGLPLGTRGGLRVSHTFPVDGEYTIRVKLLETTLGGIRGLEFVNQVDVLIDGQRVHSAEVGGEADFVGSAVNATDVLGAINARLTVRVPVTAGPHSVAAAFRETSAAQGGNRLQYFLRSNVDTTDHTGVQHVEGITIVGPFNASGVGETPSRSRIFVCRPATVADEQPCARTIVATLARRAYRRPVTEREIDRLLDFYAAGRAGGTFDAGIARALRGILASPKFLFRIERDPIEAAGETVYRLSDLELASRLSFFLWSSLPDDELIDVATRGELHSPAVLEQQVDRMLADPKADALVQNFVGQWLQLRNLRASIPDQNEFPNFDDSLRQAFRRETELLFASVMREDRSVLDLLSADYTFANERLAQHYGMPNVYGSHFRRVPVQDDVRRGLLGHGSMLLLTSHPDRTSPVLRGKWILDNLLGTPPPPPPANVPALEESSGETPRTMRAQMEAHRANPACAGCHQLMDPLGLALEHFDAVGAWRTRDAGGVIDTAVELADGTAIGGAPALRQALLGQPESFVRTMVEKLLTYALGRGVEYYDMPTVRDIVRQAGTHDYRFSSIVHAVVASTPFQMTTALPAPVEVSATADAR